MLEFKSIKNKISFFNVALLAVTLAGFSLLLYILLHHFSIRQVDRNLHIKVQEVAGVLNSMIRPRKGVVVATIQSASSRMIMRQVPVTYQESLDDLLARRILETLDRYELRDDYTALYDLEGTAIAVSANVPPEMLTRFAQIVPKAADTNLYTTINQEKPLRLHAESVELKDGNTYVMVIATSLKELEATKKNLLILYMVSIPFVLLLGGFLGRLLALRILKPVRAVTDIANKITREDLKQRVRVTDTDEEMQHLVKSFNDMIGRLEESFNYISDFSSHVAHELKTPLAVIRGEAEIALRKERDSAEYREALEANLRESQRMIRVVEDMLYFSRLEYDPKYLDSEPVKMDALLKDICEKAKILAEEKSIQVTTEIPALCGTLQGDENSLRRLFLNLVDNALKFTPASGRVAIKAELASRRELRIRVSDTGRGIPQSELPKIFDKFYHSDKGGSAPGNGLGLSMALFIARAHQGDIQVESTPGAGTIFTVILPVSL